MKLSFLLISLIISSLNVHSQITDNNGSVEQNLQTAKAYTALANKKANDVSTIQNAIKFVKNSQTSNLVTWSKDQQKLSAYASNLLQTLEPQLKYSQTNIIGYSPLVSYIVRSGSFKKRIKNPKYNAVSKAIESLAEISNLEGQPIPLIINVCNEDPNFKEIIRRFLTSTTKSSIITNHALSNILTAAEQEKLISDPNPLPILAKVGNYCQTPEIGIINITEQLTSGQLSWAKMQLLKYTPRFKLASSVSVYGFSEMFKPPWYLFFIALLFFPGTWLYNKYYKSRSKGNTAPLWLFSAALFISFIITSIMLTAIPHIVTSTETLTISIMGVSYLLLISCLISLLPVVIIYIIFAKVSKVSAVINYPETICSIFCGSQVGALIILSYLECTRIGFASLINFSIYAVTIMLATFFISSSFSKNTLENSKVDFYKVILYTLLIPIYFIFILKWDLLTAIISSVVLLSIYSLVHFTAESVYKIIIAKFTTQEANDLESAQGGLQWLRNNLKTPPYFCTPGEETLNSVVDFIVKDQDSKIEIVFIEAEQGCGKTRLANELAKRVGESYEEENITILFGDCDEPFTSSDCITYEPFVQALGDRLGIGRFMNPTEKIEKLRSGLVGTGMNLALSMTGVGGALNHLMDIESSSSNQKYNIDEIVTVIAQTFVELSKSSMGRVIFILDDTQWIDEETHELLKLLLLKLDSEFDENEICFIFTSRPVPETDKIKVMLKEFENKNVINVNTTLNQQAIEKPEFVDGLLKTLAFDFHSRSSIRRFVLSQEIHRPLQILQFLENALDNNMIESIGDVFSLSHGADLKKLPPPHDYQRMVEAQLSNLSPKLIDILQCCALMGRSFKASIVSKIFNIDLLELLTLFKDAEMKNIITDVANEDDVFDFFDKRMVSIFKNLGKDSKNPGSGTLSQKVREYHKRFLELKESELIEKGLNFEDISYREVLNLATHATAISDNIPQKALDLNRLAGLRTYDKGLFITAQAYYKSAQKIHQENSQNCSALSVANLYLSYIDCLIDMGKQGDEVEELLSDCSNAIESINEDDKSQLLDRYWLLKALSAYNTRNFVNSIKYSVYVINSKTSSTPQQFQASFLKAASMPLDKPEERYQQHSNLIENIQSTLAENLSLLSEMERVELTKILSKTLNNSGFILCFGLKRYNDAIKVFTASIECNSIKEINDQKSIAIAHGGIGDCYNQLGKFKLAQEEYRQNLEISQKSGDQVGIIRMTSMIGSIRLKEASKDIDNKENLVNEAFDLYDQSFTAAISVKNTIGTCYALAGMINCINKGNLLSRDKYIVTMLERLINKEDLSTYSGGILEVIYESAKDMNNKSEILNTAVSKLKSHSLKVVGVG